MSKSSKPTKPYLVSSKTMEHLLFEKDSDPESDPTAALALQNLEGVPSDLDAKDKSKLLGNDLPHEEMPSLEAALHAYLEKIKDDSSKR